MKKKTKIGFIGQGWIGKNYADDFEERGFDIVRYSKEPEYVSNKDKITECDIVFVAVPTPTTPNGFDGSIVASVLSLVGKEKIAVIKSTILPGDTELLQKKYPDIFIFHNPEFLVETSARFDASNPKRNIIGFPFDTEVYRQKAKEVMNILPKAPYNKIVPSNYSEFIKYAGNCFLYSKVVFVNLLHDIANKLDVDWATAKEIISADLRIGDSHMEPLHKSGRGAGGDCFIKDFAAFKQMYDSLVGDSKGMSVLKAIEDKNIDLLLSSEKDLDLLSLVYGDDIIKK